MKKLINTFASLIIYSNVIISLGAYFVTMITIDDLHLIGVEGIPLFVFFATLFAYSYQRQVKIKFFYDRQKNDRARWMIDNKSYNLLIIVIAIVGLIFALTRISSDIFLYTVPFGIVTLAYILPTNSIKSLRDLPFVKILLIAAIWSYSTVILPFLMSENPSFDQLSLIIYALNRFLFIVAITIPFDIRDINIDSKSMRTIPQVFGIIEAKTIAISLLILALILSFALGIYDCAYAAAALFASLLIIKSEENLSDLYYLGLIDGTLILWYVLRYSF